MPSPPAPYRLEFEQWVRFPLERVFRFFANPRNLPRLLPPFTAAQVLRTDLKPPPLDATAAATASPLAGAGSVVVISVRIFPFLPWRTSWITRITEFEWNHHFVDVQERGPFDCWRHRHEFASELRNGIDGTLVSDVLDYKIGFGPLGAMAQKFLVADQMERNFVYRQKILESLLAQQGMARREWRLRR